MVVAASAVGTSRRASSPRSPAEKAKGGNRHEARWWKPGESRPKPQRNRTEGFPGKPAATRRDGHLPGRTTTSSLVDGTPAAPGSGRRAVEDLEGEQSPWEERTIHRWQRRRIATDSSVEKSPGIGAYSGERSRARHLATDDAGGAETSGAHARRDRPACRIEPTTSRRFHRPLQRTSVRRRRATPRSPVFGRSERAPRPPTGSPVDGVLGDGAKVASVTDATRAGGETASAGRPFDARKHGPSPPPAHFGVPGRRERLLRQPASAGIPPSSEEGMPERKASAPAQFGFRQRLFGGEGARLERGGRRPTVGRQRPQ